MWEISMVLSPLIVAGFAQGSTSGERLVTLRQAAINNGANPRQHGSGAKGALRPHGTHG